MIEHTMELLDISERTGWRKWLYLHQNGQIRFQLLHNALKSLSAKNIWALHTSMVGAYAPSRASPSLPSASNTTTLLVGRPYACPDHF